MGNLFFWKMFHMITGGHFQCHDHRPKEGTIFLKEYKGTRMSMEMIVTS